MPGGIGRVWSHNIDPIATVSPMRHTSLPAAPLRRRRRTAAASALCLGAAALTGLGATVGATTAAAAPSASADGAPTVRQYRPTGGAGASEAAGRGVLGEHRLLIQPVYWGDAPAALDNAAIGASVQEASAYLRATTGSAISATLVQVRPWAKISLTEEQASSCDLDAIEAAARAVAPDAPGTRSHLQIVLPESSACDFSTLASRGLTAAGDGVSFFNGAPRINAATLAFGIGSNAGLGMSDSLDCWDDAAHTNPVALSAYCKTLDGGDPWDLMSGRWPYDRVGNLSAANLRRLGVLDAQAFPEITPGTAAYPFVRPLSARSGQRGFAVTLGTVRYTVEYRTATGLDEWIDDTTWVDPAGESRTDPGGGVIVRMQDLASSDPASSVVLDFHADGIVGATERHPGLEPGESWATPGEVMRLTVLSATDAGASVKVEFPALAKVERWSGADRYGASAAISARTFSPGVPVAYVASGEVYADALSGAPVAGKDRGPILLTRQDEIPGAIQAELRRLQPGRIVVLGGPSTVTDGVLARLQTYTAGGVTRWSGADRFSTSAAISANSFPAGVKTAYIASGRIYTDALSGAPVAGKNSNPVLLVDTATIPDSIQAELRRLQPQRIVVFGGPNTVSPQIEAQLKSFTSGTVARWSGADRFETSAAISRDNYGPGVGVVFVASGRTFPDALSGAPVAGVNRGPVLLVDTNRLPDVVATEVERLQPRRIVVLGGPATVSESVRAQLGSYLR
mgnify:CR=1 FL=1